MKKITLCILAIFFAIGLSAQTHFGVKAGLNFNSIKDISVSKENVSWNKTGWHAGVLLQAKLPLGLAFQPELLYSVKNFGAGDHKFDLNYFELPLNLQWGIDLILLRPFVMAAPYVSYLAKVGGEAKKWEGVKNLDYGFGLGFGLDVWKIQITGKYNWGFGKLAKVDSSDWKVNDSTLKVFQLSLGLLF
ncbi:MAG: PorT family protein [Prevotellaceae bacterium]|jgi:hypothetical protein|nr:PorT family protein [Prevotellaceae bacterium]